MILVGVYLLDNMNYCCMFRTCTWQYVYEVITSHIRYVKGLFIFNYKITKNEKYMSLRIYYNALFFPLYLFPDLMISVFICFFCMSLVEDHSSWLIIVDHCIFVYVERIWIKIKETAKRRYVLFLLFVCTIK